jgi:DNA-binding transcriptional regulator YiaG
MSPLDFANLIKAARRQQNLSQSQAAAKWDVPVRTLQQWEQGANSPGAKHLEKLLPLLSAPRKKKKSP